MPLNRTLQLTERENHETVMFLSNHMVFIH